MKLSIIIPTYNSSKVIGRALDSIVAQTFGDWEVLVMDGVSKDNTGEIVKSYNDERIKFYSEPDKGIYDAMNKGIKKAHGEWLYFLGSDDWLYDNEVLAYFFRDNDFSGYDVVYGDVDAPQLIDNYKGAWSLDNLKYNRCHQAIFYRKYMFDRLGLYNTKYKIKADHDYNLRWYLDLRTHSKYVERIIAKFCENGVSSNSIDYKFNKNIYKLILVSGRNTLDYDYVMLYLDKWAYVERRERRLIKYFQLYLRMKVYELMHKHIKRL